MIPEIEVVLTKQVQGLKRRPSTLSKRAPWMR